MGMKHRAQDTEAALRGEEPGVYTDYDLEKEELKHSSIPRKT